MLQVVYAYKEMVSSEMFVKELQGGSTSWEILKSEANRAANEGPSSEPSAKVHS
jgi:hypothetical protein